jgi:hypothetical protein
MKPCQSPTPNLMQTCIGIGEDLGKTLSKEGKNMASIALFQSTSSYSVEIDDDHYNVIVYTDHNSDYTNTTILDDEGEVVTDLIILKIITDLLETI